MKIKIKEIGLISQGINELPELPVKTSYWFKRFADRLTSQMKAFDWVRKNLIKDHTKKDEKGNLLFKKDKDGKDTSEYDIINLDAYQKAFEKEIEEEFEVDFFPIKEEQFGIAEIRPTTLIKLGQIIEK